MQTIYIELGILRVLATRALSKIWPGAYLSPISPVHFVTQPDPSLPGPYSVRVRNRLSLICGTDLHLVHVDGDPRVAPAVLPGNQRTYLGHEICGEVIEVGDAVTRVRAGDRVALRYFSPTCRTQEIKPLCRHCQHGNYYLCENQSANQGWASIGGGWSDQLLVHEDQLYRPPDALSDEEVALLEPAAVGVHAVLQALPNPGDHVLVLGCGIIGLMTVQALRALAPEAHVTALARYPFQAEAARRLGAHEVRTRADGYTVTAEITGARLYRGMFGSAMLLGGFDVVYDCVGTGQTVTDALRWARAGGMVVLVGVQFKPLTVDLTPVWYQEVRLMGTMAHGMEQWLGEEIETFELTARLFQMGKLTAEGLITHRFPLSRWREAIEVAAAKRRHQAIKVAFTF
ncbi:MAG: alcohol dehydrogenase catalytic domain-containing protein [Anaerolineae bacterium]|nr:alcohol dehydrogenase catalytic domain-containing protein [Anaerolineae bacterium]MDW8100333.1 alcohol dehydrogenase catalytic domain-containing protein [Anaerolineae bacterium]